jgi:hypothetical protein
MKIVEVNQRNKAPGLAREHTHRELGKVKRAVNRAIADLKAGRKSPNKISAQVSELGIKLEAKDAAERLAAARDRLLTARALRREQAAKSRAKSVKAA